MLVERVEPGNFDRLIHTPPYPRNDNESGMLRFSSGIVCVAQKSRAPKQRHRLKMNQQATLSFLNRRCRVDEMVAY